MAGALAKMFVEMQRHFIAKTIQMKVFKRLMLLRGDRDRVTGIIGIVIIRM